MSFWFLGWLNIGPSFFIFYFSRLLKNDLVQPGNQKNAPLVEGWFIWFFLLKNGYISLFVRWTTRNCKRRCLAPNWYLLCHELKWLEMIYFIKCLFYKINFTLFAFINKNISFPLYISTTKALKMWLGST